MSDKAAKIKEMLEMQKKFIEYEHKNGVDPKDYFKPDSGHELDGYRQDVSLAPHVSLQDRLDAQELGHRFCIDAFVHRDE